MPEALLAQEDRLFSTTAALRTGDITAPHDFGCYAGLYLTTTNTDARAERLGIAFRLRSEALSDPDMP